MHHFDTSLRWLTHLNIGATLALLAWLTLHCLGGRFA